MWHDGAIRIGASMVCLLGGLGAAVELSSHLPMLARLDHFMPRIALIWTFAGFGAWLRATVGRGASRPHILFGRAVALVFLGGFLVLHLLAGAYILAPDASTELYAKVLLLVATMGICGQVLARVDFGLRSRRILAPFGWAAFAIALMFALQLVLSMFRGAPPAFGELALVHLPFMALGAGAGMSTLWRARTL